MSDRRIITSHRLRGESEPQSCSQHNVTSPPCRKLGDFDIRMAHQPFASSPPIFNSFPDLDTAGSSKQQRADASDDVRKRSGDKSRRASHKERRDRKKSHEDPAKEEGHRTRSRHAAGFESNMWFRDTKGDSLNVTYGYLHAKDVPKYNATAGEQLPAIPIVSHVK